MLLADSIVFERTERDRELPRLPRATAKLVTDTAKNQSTETGRRCFNGVIESI